ncbi:chemotaxis protein CheW [bacterium]|nr:chemotaxis protein CheW [bacterium]
MLGVTFQIADNRLALSVRSIVEVVPSVGLKDVLGGPAWLAGIALYRGHVVPVIDLYRLANAGKCPEHLSTRLIIVRINGEGDQRFIALRASNVDEVSELPDVVESEDTPPSDQPDFGRMMVHEGQVIRVLDLDRLIPRSYRKEMEELTGELTT